jgi:hypothetical protein
LAPATHLRQPRGQLRALCLLQPAALPSEETHAFDSFASLAKDSVVADWLISKHGKRTAAVHAIGKLYERLEVPLLEALLSRGAVLSRFHLQLLLCNRWGGKVICPPSKTYPVWGRDLPPACYWVLLEHAMHLYGFDPFGEWNEMTDEVAASPSSSCEACRSRRLIRGRSFRADQVLQEEAPGCCFTRTAPTSSIGPRAIDAALHSPFPTSHRKSFPIGPASMLPNRLHTALQWRQSKSLKPCSLPFLTRRVQLSGRCWSKSAMSPCFNSPCSIADLFDGRSSWTDSKSCWGVEPKTIDSFDCERDDKESSVGPEGGSIVFGVRGATVELVASTAA